MMTRRLLLPALAVLLLAGGVTPASAGPESRPHQPRITAGAVGWLAVRDVDNDGDLDILVAQNGVIRLWRNGGHGRFALATLPTHLSLGARSPRLVAVDLPEEGPQWDDDRYDAAMPRAPAIAAVIPVALVRLPSPVALHPVSLRPSSGRAPPLA
ncbi:MAG TPA: VCBS repeat-containing protein [Vicinamibacterales bacterium]|nr:VCBS repeat-containing protein [Vicinamibacterales bacterium]